MALRLERYLRQSYTYTLTPPPSDYASPYAAFLFDTRAGYCQHFAGAMAMLMRFNGIPARVAVGFTTGEVISSGVYSVATGNAHAWVEAYFPTVGWVAFDPTPGRNIPTAGASSTSPGFNDPFASDPAGPGTVTTELLPDQFPNRSNPGGATGQDSGASWFSAVRWLPWVLGVLVLLAAWPFGRRLWRERGLRRGGPDQRFAASLRLLRSGLSWYAVSTTDSLTVEEVLDIIEVELGVQPDPVLAARAGAVLFGGRAAAEADIQRSEAFRRDVEEHLRKRRGWLRTLLAWYGVPHGAPARGPAPEPYVVPDLIYN